MIYDAVDALWNSPIGFAMPWFGLALICLAADAIYSLIVIVRKKR